MIDVHLFKGNPMLFIDFSKSFINLMYQSCQVISNVSDKQSTPTKMMGLKLDDIIVSKEGIYK